MTTLFSRIPGFRVLFLVMATMFFGGKLTAQSDTLHLNYDNIKVLPHDTTLAKLDAWIKKLNGMHVNINVYAYYSKPDFKKYAQERADEMFLILNRKARSLFTIEFIGPKRGENSQRSRVDIVYQKAKTPEEIAAETAAKAKEEAAKAEEKKKKEEEKAKKDSAKKEEKSGKTKSEVAAEQTEKGDTKKGDSKKGKEEEKGAKEEKEKDDEDKDVSYSSIVTYNEGYNIVYDEVKYIQRAKFIVAQTGKPNMDENLMKTVKDWWTLNSEIKSMPYEEARKMCKENKKDTIAILSISQVKTWFTVKNFGYTYRVLKLGRAISIENTKGKVLYKQFVPIDKEKGITLEALIFGISNMNYTFNYMLTNKVLNSSALPFLFDENAKELKNKTLVIAESMKHPKLPPEEIPTYYSGKISWVSDEEAKDVILKRKDMAYVMPVKHPNTIGNYYYYIMDGATGKVYLFDEGPVFQMSMNTGFTKNIDPSQSGYVDKSNLKRFEEVVNSDAELNTKRAERAMKEREKVEEREKKAEGKEKKKKEEKEKDAAKDVEKAKKKEEKSKKDGDSKENKEEKK